MAPNDGGRTRHAVRRDAETLEGGMTKMQAPRPRTSRRTSVSPDAPKCERVQYAGAVQLEESLRAEQLRQQ
jgi:hypothetical protein